MVFLYRNLNTFAVDAGGLSLVPVNKGCSFIFDTSKVSTGLNG